MSLSESKSKGKKIQNPGLASEKFRLEMVNRLESFGIKDEVVLKAMMKIPRHNFVDSALSSRAYEDTALPIGFRQTISKPYVVAKVISLTRELIFKTKIDSSIQVNVLEVGTGCGYQAAVMAECFDNVYSVERISNLFEESRKRVDEIYSNLHIKFGDGLKGWKEKAPFDAIIFSGSLESPPLDLMNQVKIGGVMLMPIGKKIQYLVAFVKKGQTNSKFEKYVFDLVKYVPIVNGVEK